MSTEGGKRCRGLCAGNRQKGGRNEDWVEKAVRKSESITAEEALRLKVIDFVATDLNQLLEQAGRPGDLAGGGEEGPEDKRRHSQ